MFIVDGGSTDGTVEKVIELKSHFPHLHLIHNKKKIVSAGFNMAFPKTTGSYVCLFGAHSVYSDNYLKVCFDVLENDESDVVGGFTKHYGSTQFGRATALAMSSKFGVGDTEFRTMKKRAYVDSVAYAVYKREIFEEVGLLDLDLVRNQDDELHYRINDNGYRILMVPSIHSEVQVRSTATKLFSQYYQYGLFKPLVFRKTFSGLRIRHLVPSAFVFYLLSFPLVLKSLFWLLPLVLYLLVSLFNAVRVSKSLNLKTVARVVYAAFILHVSYGLGFLIGIKKVF